MLLAAAGCVISSARTDYDGTYVASETLRRIEPGDTQSSVLDLLGPPAGKSDLGDGRQRWSWRWSKVRRSRDTTLLISTSAQTVEEAGVAYVEFADGVVTDAWRE
jgi:outer membrane protein assembly factor BamE (lipoprotein component of BamABCDE complex)